MIRETMMQKIMHKVSLGVACCCFLVSLSTQAEQQSGQQQEAKQIQTTTRDTTAHNTIAYDKTYDNVIEIVPDNTPVQQVIVDMNRRLFDLLQHDAAALKQDEQLLIKKLEATLQDVVDFQLIAARVMGRYYRQATRQQKLDFFYLFKQSLVRAYVKNLLDEDTEALAQKLYVKIFPAKNSSRQKDKSRIETELRVENKPYTVIYSLYANKQSGKWLVENLEVEGINIGITLRNQFNLLADQYRGNLDQVIASWSADAVSVQSDHQK